MQLLHAHLTDPALRRPVFTLVREQFRQMYDSAESSVEGLMQLEGERFLAAATGATACPCATLWRASAWTNCARLLPYLRKPPWTDLSYDDS